MKRIKIPFKIIKVIVMILLDSVDNVFDAIDPASDGGSKITIDEWEDIAEAIFKKLVELGHAE